MRCLLPRRLRVLAKERHTHRSEKQIMRNHIQKGVQHLKIEATWTHTQEKKSREWLLYGEREKKKETRGARPALPSGQHKIELQSFFLQKSRTQQTHTTSSVFFFLLFSGMEKACVGNRVPRSTKV
jgi:hypothetical protein